MQSSDSSTLPRQLRLLGFLPWPGTALAIAGETFPPYLLAFLLGFASGAAMIPYSTIKEVNPDNAKGSATGAMNFIVFVLSGFLGPAYGLWLQKLADGGPLTEEIFSKTGSVFVVAIVIALFATLFLRETGSAARVAK